MSGFGVGWKRRGHHPVLQNLDIKTCKHEGRFCGHFSRTVVSDFRSLRSDIVFRSLLARRSPAGEIPFPAGPLSPPRPQPGRTVLQQDQATSSSGDSLRQTCRQLLGLRPACVNQAVAARSTPCGLVQFSWCAVAPSRPRHCASHAAGNTRDAHCDQRRRTAWCDLRRRPASGRRCRPVRAMVRRWQ
jgi:hypothetical protein